MVPRRCFVVLIAALIGVGLVLLGACTPALTSSATAAVGDHRLGTVPMLPDGARRLGALAPRTDVSIAIALTPRRAGALAAYAAGVSDPQSPDFHRYLDAAQLRSRFGPSAASLARVQRSLRVAGLPRGRVSANGLLIDLSASVRALDHAFSTRIQRVRLPGGRLAYTNTRAPRVPADTTSLIQGVVGLSDVAIPHALGLAREQGVGHAHADARRAAAAAHSTSAPVPSSSCQASSTAAEYGAYTADEIASAYGFDSLYGEGDYGGGQTVGLVEFEEYSTGDVEAYEACYGIDGGSASDVSTTVIDGGVNGNGTDTGSVGSGEAALDIEQIVGLAPGADVDVYEAPDTEAGLLDAYDAMVDNPDVSVISTSWGECEAFEGSGDPTAESKIFQEAAAAGKSVYAAAGDQGSSDCNDEKSRPTVSGGSQPIKDPSLAVDDPGSQPDVTAVGGTSLPSASDSAGQSVWNDSSIANGAGGGGISSLWPMPSYQSQASSALGVIGANSSGTPCGAGTGDYCREVPDVSADADPQTGYVFYYDGGWTVLGGTSAAAPLWAALTAEADASSACAGTTIGQANPVLYAVADDAYPAAFTDITSGDTDYTPSGYGGGLYVAATGYDMASGLGAPDVAALVPDMCAVARSEPVPDTTTSSSSSSSSNSSTTSGSTSTTTTTTPTSSPTAANPTTSTPTSTSPAATPTTTSSSSSSPSPTTGTDTSTLNTRCETTTILRSGVQLLSVSAHRRSARLSLTLGLPSGCRGATLSLTRRITTTERSGTHATDTLRIQLVTGSGSLVSTLATVSNRNAGPSFQTLRLSLSRYLGRGLMLRLVATRGGSGTTTFALRSIAVSLS